jgi:hypothetical protein
MDIVISWIACGTSLSFGKPSQQHFIDMFCYFGVCDKSYERNPNE